MKRATGDGARRLILFATGLTVAWVAGFAWWIESVLGLSGLVALPAARIAAFLAGGVAPLTLMWALVAVGMRSERAETAARLVEERLNQLAKPRPELAREFLNLADLLRARQEAVDRAAATALQQVETAGEAFLAQAKGLEQSAEAALARLEPGGEALRTQAEALSNLVSRMGSRLEAMGRIGDEAAGRLKSTIGAAEAQIDGMATRLEEAVARRAQAFEADQAALLRAMAQASEHAATATNDIRGLADRAADAAGGVVKAFEARLGDFDAGIAEIERRAGTAAAGLVARLRPTLDESHEVLERLGTVAAGLERQGQAAMAAVRTAVEALRAERLATEETLAEAGAALAGAGDAVKSQGRVAALTADSVALRLKQLDQTMATQLERLEARSRTVASQATAQAGPPSAEHALSALRAALAELAATAGEIGEGLGEPAAGDRSAALRRVADRLNAPAGAALLRGKLAASAELRRAVTRFMGRFERLLREAGDGQPDDLLTVSLLTADVGRVYLALAKTAARRPQEAERVT